MIADLSCSRPRPGSPGRTDTIEVMNLLIAFGADPHQRGLNDYTPLHMAVSERHAEAVKVLLTAGADPHLPTRIDECESALELATRSGQEEVARLMQPDKLK